MGQVDLTANQRRQIRLERLEEQLARVEALKDEHDQTKRCETIHALMEVVGGYGDATERFRRWASLIVKQLLEREKEGFS
jgi:hypothetical protein